VVELAVLEVELGKFAGRVPDLKIGVAKSWKKRSFLSTSLLVSGGCHCCRGGTHLRVAAVELRGVRRCELNETLRRDPTRLDTVVEQQRQPRLDSRAAVGNVPEVPLLPVRESGEVMEVIALVDAFHALLVIENTQHFAVRVVVAVYRYWSAVEWSRACEGKANRKGQSAKEMKVLSC
jgi:hypothetical protein